MAIIRLVALLVRDGEIVMEAENTVESEVDITGHAELNLVRRAVHELGEEVVKACTLYTSTEPCAMCSGAIYWSGISRVVYACSAKRLGEIAGGSLLFSLSGSVCARRTIRRSQRADFGRSSG